MSELTKEQISACRISDGVVLNEKNTFRKNGFHFGILRERSDVNVVPHFVQSSFTTAVACSGRYIRNFFLASTFFLFSPLEIKLEIKINKPIAKGDISGLPPNFRTLS